MELHPSEKLVTLSVREFAEFREVAQRTGGARTGIWRAAVGSELHRQLEAEAVARADGTRCEVAIDITWSYRGWRLHLQGRMDQLHSSESVVSITEVKSVQGLLPLPAEAVESTFPGYVNQLATYCVLATQVEGLAGKSVQGTLLLVDIDTGIQQYWPLPQPAMVYFEAQIDRLHTFLESRWSGRERRRHLQINPAFESYREGQRETQLALESCLNQSPVVMLEAPTGFGKTGIVLQTTLQMLKSGQFDRIIYLTSKSTGQLQAWKQLHAMMPPETDPPRYFQLRNRAEHEEGFPPMESAPDLERLWERSGITPSRLLEAGTLTLERIRSLARESGLPPYEITRAVLPHADIWLADYNYLFSPSARGLFEATLAFDPSRTILIIDEAHNLPGRAAAALSASIRADDWDALLFKLRQLRVPPRLCKTVEDWLNLLDGLKPADSHPPTLEYEVRGVVLSLVDALRSEHFDWRLLSDTEVELLFQIQGVRTLIEHELIKKIYHSSLPGLLEITCLDASSEIRHQLLRFGTTVMMSATLQPAVPFAQSCGLEQADVSLLEAPAPWRSHAYRIAIDARVDTRWKSRERYFATSAETIRLMVEQAAGPVAVFFPSYRYAETIAEYLKVSDPFLRTALQPRGATLQDQSEFIEWSIQQADALFLILGTGFSEGIDSLGGRVHHAIVVGPALPEVNAIQQARMNLIAGESRDDAFRRVYQIPAIQKINQALGRLVRAPGQQAEVLLHCRRFADPQYRDLLAPEYREGPVLRNDDELLMWLRQPSRSH